MRYLKTFEAIDSSLDKENLSELKETIEMIFVDLIDDGFSVQITTSQREKVNDMSYTFRQGKTDKYSKCNVIGVRLVRFKSGTANLAEITGVPANEIFGDDFSPYNNKSEDYKHIITDCFHTLLDLLDKKWNGAKLERIIREDAVTANETYFHNIDEEKIWSRDFISISFTITKTT